MFTKIAAVVVMASTAVLTSSDAALSAGANLYDPSVATCTGLNCSSVLLNGTTGSIFNRNDPWSVGLYARAGECVRIQTLSQTADLENVTVAPDGSVFRNDDQGGAVCPLCSLVKFIAPNTGWNTVALNHFAGTPTSADFQIAYGRYNAGNPNCAAPTPPLAVAVGSSAAVSKGSGGNVAPAGDGPIQ